MAPETAHAADASVRKTLNLTYTFRATVTHEKAARAHPL
jgi:hypothetical protein